ELISGVHPFAPDGFANENVFTLVRRIVGGARVSLADHAPWAPPYVVATIDTALARAADDRHPTAAAFAAALSADLERLAREVGPGEPLETLVEDLDRTASAPRPPAAGEGTGAPETVTIDDDAETNVMVRER